MNDKIIGPTIDWTENKLLVSPSEGHLQAAMRAATTDGAELVHPRDFIDPAYGPHPDDVITTLGADM